MPNWFAPRFLIQGGSIWNGRISLRRKPATVLIRECHTHVIFGETVECFWSYLVMFAETVADNSCWCLITRVNLGFTDVATCFTVSPLPVLVCLPWRRCCQRQGKQTGTGWVVLVWQLRRIQSKRSSSDWVNQSQPIKNAPNCLESIILSATWHCRTHKFTRSYVSRHCCANHRVWDITT